MPRTCSESIDIAAGRESVGEATTLEDYSILAKVRKYKLVPRESTALVDAVGRAINETGERLAKMPEAERLGLVVFVVMADGLENSSREFTKSQIEQMIEHQ